MRAGPTEREILEDRARALARPAAEAWVPTRRVVAWRSAGTRLAIDVAWVRSVRRRDGLARLPLTASPLDSVVEDRGVTVPLLPAADLLGMASSTGAGTVVLLEGPHRAPLGLLTDDLPELVDLPVADLRPVPDTLARPHPRLVAGVDVRGTILLDASALLADPSLTLPTS